MLANYINIEAKRIVTNIASNSINKIAKDNLSNDLLNINKNKNNELELITYNTKKVNELLNIINKSIQKKLLLLEEGDTSNIPISSTLKKGNFKNIKKGVVYEVTLGSLNNSTLFANIGPTIPIKMTFIGEITSNLKTKITGYGINNLVIESYIETELFEQSTMPITSKKQKIKISTPLSIEIVQGNIPSYYYGGFSNTSSNSSLPLK